MNLLSLSALIDQIDCRVTLDKKNMFDSGEDDWKGTWDRNEA